MVRLWYCKYVFLLLHWLFICLLLYILDLGAHSKKGIMVMECYIEFVRSFIPSPFFCYCSLRLFVLYSCLVWLKINPPVFLPSFLPLSYFLSLFLSCLFFLLFIYLFLFLFIVSLPLSSLVKKTLPHGIEPWT